jgi:hypothetical protein
MTTTFARQADTSASSEGLNDRSLGWLRFLWDKATTDAQIGPIEPHLWWDRYSEPRCVRSSIRPRHDGLRLPMMLEATPAWRGYTRVLDELARRYVSFWGGIDWNTLIGPDPGVDKYPPEWLTVVPEHLRGRYSLRAGPKRNRAMGFAAGSVGCDGNLFYRGWLNLLLGIRHYVWQPTQDRAFEVSGYQNRTFSWTHQRIAQFISDQLTARPQGAHCEHQDLAVLHERGRSGSQALRLAAARRSTSRSWIGSHSPEALHGP